MDDAQVHVTEKPAPPGTAVASVLPRAQVPSIRKTGVGLQFSRALKFLASLRLTVVLFALSIILVFCGTLAQVDSGLWTAVEKYFRSFSVWIPLQIFFPRPERGERIGGGFPFPGGWLLGSLLLVNLLAAHAVRFKFTTKRIGIIVLHSGLIIMMVSELLTGLFAVEGSMMIFQGQSSNYLTHPRETELAIIPEGTSENTDVIAVPMKLLKHGGTIKDAALPFDVEVVKYMVNSNLYKQDVPAEFVHHDFAKLPTAPRGMDNPANAGLAAKLYVATDQRETGGVEQNKEDRAAAYVRFREKQSGRDLGTYLVGVLFEDTPQTVTAGGKNYDVRLRLKRSYQPYSVHLIKFTHDTYQGTEKPKNFASRVRLTDPSKGVDREALIYMNNPLYYGGETFYQQSFLPGDKATILQVVRNPAWTMPYLSFFMVAIGLMYHFGFTLVGFLNSAKVKMAGATASLLPAGLAAGVGAVYFLYMMIPPGDGADKMRLTEAAKLPALEGGRVMPLDSVARNSLMAISGGAQTFVDGDKNTQPAIRWLMDVMVAGKGDGPAFTHKVFRIENFQVQALLGLEKRKGYRYSLDEIFPRRFELDREFKRAIEIRAQERDVFESKVVELSYHIRLFQDLSEWEIPKIVPPLPGSDKWLTLREAFQHDMHNKNYQTGSKEFALMLAAYAKQDSKSFNASLEVYRKTIEKQAPQAFDRADFETFFNHFSPFTSCAVMYVLVVFLAAASWLIYVYVVLSANPSWRVYAAWIRQAAFGLAVLTLVVHTFALFSRMYMMDRPLVFVTNLYSSAIFIGWMCVILGLVLEWIFQIGLGSFVGGVTGFATLLVAYFLGSSGDTMEMMQAVLDTNFWLATHVTSVTIGYAATFVAGFLGIALIIFGMFSKLINKEISTLVYRIIGRMIYGIVCFAMLFSFVGTVLGGLWADYSWGRFWGWDPKENGALLIVLWNALILHARWCGLVQQRGMAILAVGGNIVTTWSWWGVNMLGVGLHAYAESSGRDYMLAFIGSQLVIIAIGLVPMRLWPGFAVSALVLLVGAPTAQATDTASRQTATGVTSLGTGQDCR